MVDETWPVNTCWEPYRGRKSIWTKESKNYKGKVMVHCPDYIPLNVSQYAGNATFPWKPVKKAKFRNLEENNISNWQVISNVY